MYVQPIPLAWRIGGFFSMVCALLIGSALADDPATADRSPAKKPASVPVIEISKAAPTTEQAIRKALETQVPVDFKDAPLNQALQQIAQAAGVNVWLDVQALTEEGVPVDEPITLQDKPLAAARVLDRMIVHLGLCWIIHDQVVRITTIIAAEEILITRTYPVEDLLAYGKTHKPDLFSALPDKTLQPVQFGGCGNGLPPSIEDLEGQWLIDSLQQLTSGPWQDIDGTGGTVSILKNSLVVRQTHKMQTEVEQLIHAIRGFTKGTLANQPRAVRPPHYAEKEDAAIQKSLETVLNVKCQDVPLNQFIKSLAEKLNVTAHLEQQALTEEGVPTDEPIHCDLKNVSARSGLKLVLEPLGLTTLIEDGWLVVTTIIAAEERLVTIAHDVRDLIQQGYTGQQLQDALVQDTSGPWEAVDGTGGNPMEPLKGLLLVRQTQKVHQEIAAVLADLRKHLAEQQAAGTAEAQKPPNPQDVVTRFYRLDVLPNAQQLENALLTLIEPKSWANQGGEGVIVFVNTAMVIKTSVAVHEKIRKFLQDLNQVTAPSGFGGGFGGAGSPKPQNPPQPGGNFFRVPPGT